MAKREIGEINAGSMADIAFLLLIFFLVTTTMDQDKGIARMLPPITEDQPEIKIFPRNVFIVLANSRDQLLVENEPMELKDLRAKTREFYTNPGNANPDLPQLNRISRPYCDRKISEYRSKLAGAGENTEAILQDSIQGMKDRLAAIELIGDYRELPPTAIISLRNDRGTSYSLYIGVQNELQAAINELRDELSQDKFGVDYEELDKESEEGKRKIKAIRRVYPQKISEQQPLDTQNP